MKEKHKFLGVVVLVESLPSEGMKVEERGLVWGNGWADFPRGKIVDEVRILSGKEEGLDGKDNLYAVC